MKNPSWKTYRNRFKAHGRELERLANAEKKQSAPATLEEIAQMWWISPKARAAIAKAGGGQ